MTSTHKTIAPGGGRRGRWWVHLILAFLALGSLACLHWLLADRTGPLPFPWLAAFSSSSYHDGLLIVDLATVLVAGRLLGLLLAPAGRPLRSLERLVRRSSWFAASGDSVVADRPWRQVCWSTEAGIALGFLILTLMVSWADGTLFNPEQMPQGSDQADYLLNSWLLIHGLSDGYAHQRYPGYSWFAGHLSWLMDWTLVKGAIVTSRVAMSMAVVGVYGAVRLLLGRTAAVATCLIFISSALFHRFTNYTSSYGLFTCFTILAVAFMAYLLRNQRPWVWAAIGTFLGLSYTVDVKAISVAMVTAPYLGIFALLPWWRSRRHGIPPLRACLGRSLGPALCIIMAVSIGGLIYLHPTEFLPLERKLDIQAREVFRDLMPNKDPQSWKEGEALDALPSWPSMLLNNIHRAGSIHGTLANHGLILLLLAAAGALAPILASRGRPWQQRLHRAAGVLLMLMVVMSASSAFLFYFFSRYVIHALPFFIGLGCLGCLALAAWTTPREAPRVLPAVTGCVLIAFCSQGLGRNTVDIRPLQLLIGLAVQQKDPIHQHDSPEFKAREVARWIEKNYGEDVPLVLCERGLVAAHMKRALSTPPAGDHYTHRCKEPEGTESAPRRLWIIEEVPFKDFVDKSLQEPRFKVVRKVPINAPGRADNNLFLALETRPGTG